MTSLRTAEPVPCGHPDKFRDQISDTLLSMYLHGDPTSRCAIEAVAKNSKVFVVGEVTSNTEVDIDEAVNSLAVAIYGREVEVVQELSIQSPEIFDKVRSGGAGDQGIMTGYATTGTLLGLPEEYELATNILRGLQDRHNGQVLASDAKSQVTLDRYGNITHLLVSGEQLIDSLPDFRTVIEESIMDILEEQGYNAPAVLHINPGGAWYQGGPWADSGLTGRKITADTYGPSIPHGGGAFSGKDPSKVDRSGAYMARAAALERAQVQVAYEIGTAEPVSLRVDGFGAGRAAEAKAERLIRDLDWTPNGIIDNLGLLEVNYAPFSVWGHFSHTDAPWSQTLPLNV